MIPICEFGDCTNDVVLKQKFNEIEFGICTEHREAIYEVIEGLSWEWSRARRKIIRKLFKVIREGGK